MSVATKPACLSPSLKVPRTKRHLLGDAGFTLVEIVIAFAIVAILVVIAIPSYEKVVTLAKEARAMGEIRGMEKAIGIFAMENNGVPPADIDAIPGIETLHRLDPWGRPYVYHKIASGSPGRWAVAESMNKDYDLYSTGADGQSDIEESHGFDVTVNQDDIVRVSDGAYVGLARSF